MSNQGNNSQIFRIVKFKNKIIFSFKFEINFAVSQRLAIVWGHNRYREAKELTMSDSEGENEVTYSDNEG